MTVGRRDLVYRFFPPLVPICISAFLWDLPILTAGGRERSVLLRSEARLVKVHTSLIA